MSGLQTKCPYSASNSSSHKGGARCLPTVLWCACSWSVSGSWVLFRVWNYLRRLLANASGAWALRLCLYASICVCVCRSTFVCWLFPVRTGRESLSRSHYVNIFRESTDPKAQLLITCIQMISSLKANTHTQTRKHTRCICTELVFHRAAVWWNADGADTWPFHQTVLTPQAPYLLCVQRCVCVSLCLWLPKCAHAGMWEDEVKEGENKNKYSPLNPSLGLVIETTSGKDKCPVCVSARHNHSFQPLWLL